MPANHDHIRESAAAASAALRAFAADARDGIEASDTRKLISELLLQLNATRQILGRISSAQMAQRSAARSTAGQLPPGVRDATASSDELRRAAALLDQVEFRIDAAAHHSQNILWLADGAPSWVHVLTVRGDAADAIDDAIDHGNVEAAISRLAAFDHGEETTFKALDAGEYYQQLPAGPIDRTATSGEYALISRPLHGDVLLLRALTEPDPPPSAQAGARRNYRLTAPHRAPQAGDALPTRREHRTAPQMGLSL